MNDERRREIMDAIAANPILQAGYAVVAKTRELDAANKRKNDAIVDRAKHQKLLVDVRASLAQVQAAHDSQLDRVSEIESLREKALDAYMRAWVVLAANTTEQQQERHRASLASRTVDWLVLKLDAFNKSLDALGQEQVDMFTEPSKPDSKQPIEPYPVGV